MPKPLVSDQYCSFGTTFPGLPTSPTDGGAARKLRICILTQDIVGPIHNGGIGTAYYYAAQLLADGGHEVTIAYALGQHCESESIEHWVRFYADLGVRFVPLPDPEIPSAGDAVSATARIARNAYEWLRKQADFDIVHVSEWRGTGYFCLVAKHLGLDFPRTLFAVKTSSPTLWNHIGNAEPVRQAASMVLAYLERRSVELADVVISGSQYMLNWMADNGYAMPSDRCFAQPNIFLTDEDEATATQPGELREIVFFGRLEPRKGLYLFCDAVSALVCRNELPATTKITFLGKLAQRFGSRETIDAAASAWPVEVQIISDCGQPEALAYLKSPGRLAVLAPTMDNSPFGIYECLAHRIPFIASNVGGIPELVHVDDRPHTLFSLEPAELAARLRRAVLTGMTAPRASYDNNANNARWLQWHQSISTRTLPGEGRDSEVERSHRPLVSICVTGLNTREREDEFTLAVSELDYPELELILAGPTHPVTPGVAAEAADPLTRVSVPVRRVTTTTDSIAQARNAGAREARGEFMMFVDVEDILCPRTVSQLVDAAEFSGAATLSWFTNRVSDGPADSPPATRCETPLGADVAAALFTDTLAGEHVFVRSAIFRTLGGFAPATGLRAGTREFCARATLSGHQHYVLPRTLSTRRENSVVPTRASHYEDEFAVALPYRNALQAQLKNLALFAQGAHVFSEELLADKARLQNELRQRADEMKQLDTRYQRRVVQRDRLDREHALAIIASRSWRCGAPIRRLLRRLGIGGAEVSASDIIESDDPGELVRSMQNSVSWEMFAPLRVLLRLFR